MTHPLLNHAANLLKATVSFMVVALAFISTTVFAEPAQWADWRQTIAGGVGGSLAQAPYGDYVALGLESPNIYDPAYGAHLILQRYSSDGQPVWPAPVRWATTNPGVRPYGLVVDASGNTFVLATDGDYDYPLCAPPPCPDPPPPLTLFNGYWLVQKYSPDGVLLWQRRQLQVGVAPVQGVVDAAGDLYVAFDPSSAGRTAITSKLSGANGATLWTATTPDGAKPGAIALSSSGTVLVAAAGTFFGLSLNEYAQDSGARLTRTVYADGVGYYAPGMALGPRGEIAFTGKSAKGLFLGLENAARQTVFTSSTTPGAQGRQVTVDALGRVVVAGTAPGTIGTHWLLARYDATGSPAHAPVVFDRHASATEAPLALAAAADGAAYITGAASAGSDPNATQAVTVRLTADGSIDWVASEAAGLRGVGAALASDDSVAVLTAGGMSLVHYPVPLLNRVPISAILVTSVSGLQVGFDASGSTDPDGTVATYQWTFGDGSSLLTNTPTTTHSYPGTGTYTASVVAVDNLGLSGAAASTGVSVVVAPTPTALTLSPTAVRGGSNVTGRVTLSGAAGAVVRLSSSKPAVASVPSTVNVSAGSSSTSFAIRTYKVKTNTAVTITATVNGKSTSAVLTVNR